MPPTRAPDRMSGTDVASTIDRLREHLDEALRSYFDAALDRGVHRVDGTPGSGKTELEAAVALKAMLMGYDVLMTSFMKDPTVNFKKRLANLAARFGIELSDLRGRLNVRTLHSLALQENKKMLRLTKIVTNSQEFAEAAVSAQVEAARLQLLKANTGIDFNDTAELWTAVWGMENPSKEIVSTRHAVKTHPNHVVATPIKLGLEFAKAMVVDDDAMDEAGFTLELKIRKTANVTGEDRMREIAKNVLELRRVLLARCEPVCTVDPYHRAAASVTAAMKKRGEVDHDLSLHMYATEKTQCPVTNEMTVPPLVGDDTVVIIDEAQDTQTLMLERLVATGNYAAALHLGGDPQQSVCSFQSAHPEAMNTLCAKCTAVGVPVCETNITQNRRCTQNVAMAADAMLPKAVIAVRGKMVCTRKSGKPVLVGHFVTPEQEAVAIAAYLRPMLQAYADALAARASNPDGDPDENSLRGLLGPGDVVFLSRRNRNHSDPLCKEISTLMKTMGLPPPIVRGRPNYDACLGLIALLKFAVGIGKFDVRSDMHVHYMMLALKALPEKFKSNENVVPKALEEVMERYPSISVVEAFGGCPCGGQGDELGIGEEKSGPIGAIASFLAQKEEESGQDGVKIMVDMCLEQARMQPIPPKHLQDDGKKGSLATNIRETAAAFGKTHQAMKTGVLAVLANDIDRVPEGDCFNLSSDAALGNKRLKKQDGSAALIAPPGKKTKPEQKQFEEQSHRRRAVQAMLQESNTPERPMGRLVRQLIEYVVRDALDKPTDAAAAVRDVYPIRDSIKAAYYKLNVKCTNVRQLIKIIEDTEAALCKSHHPEKAACFATVYTFKGDERKVCFLNNAGPELTNVWLDDVRDMKMHVNLHAPGCKSAKTGGDLCKLRGTCRAFWEKQRKELAERERESMRLVHVAMTRARDELIVTGSGGKTGIVIPRLRADMPGHALRELPSFGM